MNKLKKYLSKGGDPNAYINNRSQLLIYMKNTACFELLLKKGANPNQQVHSYSSLTPLLDCITFNYKNRTEIVELLLQYKADVNKKLNLCHPIFLVCITEFKILNMLLDHGADVNAENENGLTIMDIYLRSPLKTHMFQFLLKHGARLRFSKFLKRRPEMLCIWARRRWAVIKCAVKFLGLQQRAVVTANHPLRKLARGEFNVEE